MNDPLDIPASPRVQRYLERLPLVAPPPALEARVFGRLRGRRQRRRALLAIAALLVIGLLPRLLAPGLPEPSSAAASGAVDPMQLRADVRALDRQLQAAYAGTDARDRTDALWLAREAAARRLADPTAVAQQPIRL